MTCVLVAKGGRISSREKEKKNIKNAEREKKKASTQRRNMTVVVFNVYLGV
jgi:hypothetical protein